MIAGSCAVGGSESVPAHNNEELPGSTVQPPCSTSGAAPTFVPQAVSPTGGKHALELNTSEESAKKRQKSSQESKATKPPSVVECEENQGRICTEEEAKAKMRPPVLIPRRRGRPRKSEKQEEEDLIRRSWGPSPVSTDFFFCFVSI